MTGPVTTEALVDQIARILDPDAHHLGLPDYYGPEPILAGASARVRVARKNAGAILAGPLAPLLAAHQQITAERDEARDALARMTYTDEAGTVWKPVPGWQSYTLNRKIVTAEASLATATSELAQLRAEGEAAAYLIDRLQACHEGRPVRDLPEATGAYLAARAATTREG